MSDHSRLLESIETFARCPHAVFLHCGVQHYDWGSLEFIPQLLGIDNPQRQPYAELWLGAHPDLPARAVIDGLEVPLNQLIAVAGKALLGKEAVSQFGIELPYIMKVLSARQPLSIQAHPSRLQAEEGFRRENEQGKPSDDPTRNYHDPRHKPELISALTDFYALSGFRPLQDIDALLKSIPEFSSLHDRFEGTRDSLFNLYRHVMTMPQQQVDGILGPLLERLRAEHKANGFSKHDPAYWVLQADAIFSREGHQDRGLFSIFLLNLVHLPPGQAMFLRSGKLHAYLEGSGIEVMADSNNVLRGGLTHKNVDIDELLRILRFSCKPPLVLDGKPDSGNLSVSVYHSPAEEFELTRLTLALEMTWQCPRQKSISMGIVVNGNVNLVDETGQRLEMITGSAFLVPASVSYRIESESASDLFMVGVPGMQGAGRESLTDGSNQ